MYEIPGIFLLKKFINKYSPNIYFKLFCCIDLYFAFQFCNKNTYMKSVKNLCMNFSLKNG